MEAATVRILRGTGTGPTEVASYDAALAAAGVHNYNLLRVSSIVPPGARIDVAGAAPDLGPIGGRLTVVQARATVEGPGNATAALGWTRAGTDGPGVFYETGGDADPAEARRRVERGLEHAKSLRDWDLEGVDTEVATRRSDEDAITTAVVLAAYGTATPIV